MCRSCLCEYSSACVLPAPDRAGLCLLYPGLCGRHPGRLETDHGQASDHITSYVQLDVVVHIDIVAVFKDNG